MKSRHQWRAMATGRHITTAKVGDNGYAASLSNPIRIANLQRKGIVSERSVPECLAVRANCRNLAGFDTQPIQQGEDGIAEGLCNSNIKLAEGIERGLGVALRQLQNVGVDSRRIHLGQAAKQFTSRTGKPHEGNIHTVRAGA
jgi:hypothetical protein